jgi:hypothetical protein
MMRTTRLNAAIEASSIAEAARLDASATVGRYREALNTAFFFIDHGRPVPYENHSCGPESACDINCVEVAQYAEWRRAAALLAEKGVADV